MSQQVATTTEETLAVIGRFNDAFGRRDVDAVMALMTDDVIFENTSPSPDGTRYGGQADVRQFWNEFFAGSSQSEFEAEDTFAADDRCCIRWIYRWGGAGEGSGHVRGVDIFRVRDGKVAEKLSYVKG
jgi:ketosteroid isomerase-like protein